MVKITYRPWNEIIVHEYIRYELDDLLKLRSMGVSPGGLGSRLLWIDGIALDIRLMLGTESVIKEQFEGKVHWSSITFALMPEFKSVITVEGNIRIPIINVSDNPNFIAAAEWLRKEIIKE